MATSMQTALRMTKTTKPRAYPPITSTNAPSRGSTTSVPAPPTPPIYPDAPPTASGTYFGTSGFLPPTSDRVSRRVLDREHVEVDTVYGTLPIKGGLLAGEVVNAAPEYEPCRRAAVAHDVPLERVFAAAMAAFERAR